MRHYRGNLTVSSRNSIKTSPASSLTKIEMINRAERLGVVLERFAIDHFTVKPLGHKVSASILFKQTRF